MVFDNPARRRSRLWAVSASNRRPADSTPARRLRYVAPRSRDREVPRESSQGHPSSSAAAGGSSLIASNTLKTLKTTAPNGLYAALGVAILVTAALAGLLARPPAVRPARDTTFELDVPLSAGKR